MANTKQGRLKKVLESAEHDAQEVGRGIKKGATSIERAIKKELVHKTTKQEKQ